MTSASTSDAAPFNQLDPTQCHPLTASALHRNEVHSGAATINAIATTSARPACQGAQPQRACSRDNLSQSARTGRQLASRDLKAPLQKHVEDGVCLEKLGGYRRENFRQDEKNNNFRWSSSQGVHDAYYIAPINQVLLQAPVAGRPVPCLLLSFVC